METKREDGRSADVMYRVDPQKLSIRPCYTSKIADPAIKYTTDYEHFSLDATPKKTDVSEKIRELPAYIDGAYYFQTEEEAQDYIRKQIGM